MRAAVLPLTRVEQLAVGAGADLVNDRGLRLADIHVGHQLQQVAGSLRVQHMNE